MHAEDDMRFLQIQKLEMLLKSYEMVKKIETVGIAFCLKLSKGPINKTAGIV